MPLSIATAMIVERPAPEYCSDSQLAYARSRWCFEEGQALGFDDSYRLAHLPLVAPDHPAVLASMPPLDYENGRYIAARCSLIVPVDAAQLADAPAFRDLERDLRRRSFERKIDWNMVARRAAKLHVTLIGGLRPEHLSACVAAVAPLVARHAPFRYRLGGPFVGTKNRGRFYFAAYPECVDGDDVFGALQAAADAQRTHLYLLGYYNLRDELTLAETIELSDFLAAWKDVILADLTCAALVLLATHDDLALDSHVVARIPDPSAVAG